MTLTFLVQPSLRFLINTRRLAVATVPTDELFYGHPWVAHRVPGRGRRYIAGLPLTRRTHLFLGVHL